MLPAQNSSTNSLVTRDVLPLSPLLSSLVSNPPPPSNVSVMASNTWGQLEPVDTAPNPTLLAVLNGTRDAVALVQLDNQGLVAAAWRDAFSALFVLGIVVLLALIVHGGESLQQQQ